MNLNIRTELLAFPVFQIQIKNGLADPHFVFAIFSIFPIEPLYKAGVVGVIEEKWRDGKADKGRGKCRQGMERNETNEKTGKTRNN